MTDHLKDHELVGIKKFFQYRHDDTLSLEDKMMLEAKIELNRQNKVALGGSHEQKLELFKYGFYDKLILRNQEYIQKIINIIEEEDKRDFEESRPPGTTHKPLRHRHTNIILSFLAAYVQSDSRLWPEDKEIGISDLTGIAAAARAQIVLANRIATNRARNITAKKFFEVFKRLTKNEDGFSDEAIQLETRIDVILKGLRSEVSTRGHFFTKDRNQPQPEHDDDSNEFSYEDDDNRAIRKQMTYKQLVRNFSMHSEKIQWACFEAKRKLEKGFDYNQFVKFRNCLAYQFLLSNSARSEVVTYLQWSEVDRAARVPQSIGKDTEDDFIMIPFFDHKNRGRGIHAKKPLYLGMDRWMLYELTFLRGFCVPGNSFVFPSGKANKEICKKGMNASRVTGTVSEISGVQYEDHLHWIRSSATNASCISTEQSTSQMVPDLDLVILNGHSMQTAQKHYMRLSNQDRCLIAAKAYVKLAKKRREASNEVEKDRRALS